MHMKTNRRNPVVRPSRQSAGNKEDYDRVPSFVVFYTASDKGVEFMTERTVTREAPVTGIKLSTRLASSVWVAKGVGVCAGNRKKGAEQ